MRACEYEAVGMVKFLVENGVEVNAQMNTGWTAIFTAVKKNNSEIFSYLLEKDADFAGIRRTL